MPKQQAGVFISYSHRDRKWLKRLQVHLRPLERLDKIDRWDDTRLSPGEDWKAAIELALDRANIAILLVSADFLASHFITTYELPTLLEKAESDGLPIVVVNISPSLVSDFKQLDRFQFANDPERPLTSLSYPKQEMLWLKVARHIIKCTGANLGERTFRRRQTRVVSEGGVNEPPYSRNSFNVSLRYAARRFRNAKKTLLELGRNVRILEGDLAARREGPQFGFVDSYDLQLYLSFEPPASSREFLNRSDVLTEYAKILLFNKLEPPPILLPWYYDEVRTNIYRRFVDDRIAKRQSTWWTRSARRMLERALDSDQGLVRRLRAAGKSGTRESGNQLRRDVDELLRVFHSVMARVRSTHAGLEGLVRFQSLVERGRIQGLKKFLQVHNITIADDTIFHSAYKFFHSRRPRGHIVNENDARSISCVAQMNRVVDDPSSFYLISSAHTMREVVDAINAQVLESSRRVELRDIEYWKLFYSVLLRAEGEKEPTSEASSFLRSLEPLLDDAERRLMRLEEFFHEHTSEPETSHLRDSSLKSLEDLYQELEHLLQRIGEPVLNERLMLSFLGDAANPLMLGGSHLEGLSELIWEVAGRLQESGSLAELEEALQSTIRRLAAVLDNLELEIEYQSTSLAEMDEEFQI